MSRKSVQWEPSCSTQTDRRVEEETGMTQLTVAFRNVVDALKNENSFWLRFSVPDPLDQPHLAYDTSYRLVDIHKLDIYTSN